MHRARTPPATATRGEVFRDGRCGASPPPTGLWNPHQAGVRNDVLGRKEEARAESRHRDGAARRAHHHERAGAGLVSDVGTDARDGRGHGLGPVRLARDLGGPGVRGEPHARPRRSLRLQLRRGRNHRHRRAGPEVSVHAPGPAGQEAEVRPGAQVRSGAPPLLPEQHDGGAPATASRPAASSGSPPNHRRPTPP